MYNAKTTRDQVNIFIKLLFPVMIYQMISYSSGMIGTFMAGHYSTEDLAGLSMGVNVWTPIISIINTLVVAVVPIVSQLIGKGQEQEIPTKVRQFMYIGFIIGAIISLALYFSADLLVNKLGLDSSIAEITKNFLKYQSYGLISIVIYVLLRSFIDSLGLTRLSMIMMLVYVPINILLSYLFIFGKFGFPELGGPGVAVSTNITYLISFVIAVFVILKHPKINKYPVFHFEKIKLEHWPEIFKLGIPMAVAVALETFMFSLLSLMVSIFDTPTIAAHQSSLNFAGFLYGLPMSISSALTIVVAYHIGAKNYKMAEKFVKIGIGVSIVFSIITALIILLFHNQIPYLYGTDPKFLEIASKLLYFVVGFTAFDSFSACLVGVLRAYKKVVPTCICMTIGFYFVGLPVAYYSVYYFDFGVYSLWIAWLIGIAVYAILMITYYTQRIKKKYV